MANAYPTLFDIAVQNGADPLAGLIDETMKATPEVRLGAARTIPGINYRVNVRTALPTMAFRAANQGTASTKSTYENRLTECYNLNPIWQCDKAVADSHIDGAAAYIALEGSAMTLSAFQWASSQFYYGNAVGTGNDVNGFPGLIQGYNTANIIDAGGTTANTGSSVWMVKFGPTYCQWVVGQNGNMSLTDVVEQILFDTNSLPYPGYVQSLMVRLGLQFGNTKTIVRIKKLTADNLCTLTDKMISDALALFPAGYEPDVMFMTRRSRSQLRDSRTATNPTGQPAPIPEEAFGVPIAVTDGISNTESLTL
jgi:hypothetical protein